MAKRPENGLTSAFCRTAKPGVRDTPDGPELTRVSYPDGDVRGLELRVSTAGEKTWTFRYRHRVTGKQSRVTLGVYDPTTDSSVNGPDGVRRLTLHGARVAARLLRAQVDADGDPAAEKRHARRTAKAHDIKTVSDLAAAYLLACETGPHRSGKRRKKAASTLAGERWMWGRYLEKRIGSADLDTVTKSQIKNLLRAVFAEAPIQSNRCRALLSQMFNFAIGEERLSANPVAHVAPLAEERARTRTLTDAELKTFWSALQSPTGLRMTVEDKDTPVLVGRAVCIAIELAMVTLQRRAEIAGMKRAELDLEHGTWIIPEDRTKGRAEHLVPLSPRAVTLIQQALALQVGREKGESSAVFPSPRSKDTPIGAGALSHAVADIMAALKIPDASLHDLRRTGATRIAALGVPPFIVSKVLAHKDSGGGAAVTARHYNLYAYADEKRDALNRWSARLDQLFAEPGSDRHGDPAGAPDATA